MKIFLTGGSGFLGKNIIKKLVSEGHEVKALARSVEARNVVESLGASSVLGDIENSHWYHELEGMEVVIHAAAIVQYWGPWEKFQNLTVKGTINLAQAAEKAGVKRFIHISSESVLMSGKEDLFSIDENFPIPNRAEGLYAEAKRQAEVEFKKLKGEMKKIILRPSFIYGPNCPAYEKIIEKVEQKKFVWIDQGNAPFEAVHINNVVEAIKLSLSKGEDGDIFFVTDTEKENVKQFFGRIIETHGLKMPTISVPKFLAQPLAKLFEKIWSTFHFKNAPPLLPFEVDFVSLKRNYSLNKIQAQLGYQQVQKRQVF